MQNLIFESISLAHFCQKCNGCQHRPAELNTSPESHGRGDCSREIRFVRKGCERAENPCSKCGLFRPIECSATNERPRPGISTTERRRKIKGCPQKIGLPRPRSGCRGQATRWGKGKGIGSDRVMWQGSDIDGWVEVEKGIPTIYNLWDLFVQFRYVRFLARRVDGNQPRMCKKFYEEVKNMMKGEDMVWDKIVVMSNEIWVFLKAQLGNSWTWQCYESCDQLVWMTGHMRWGELFWLLCWNARTFVGTQWRLRSLERLLVVQTLLFTGMKTLEF